jgi:hypothetical protein
MDALLGRNFTAVAFMTEQRGAGKGGGRRARPGREEGSAVVRQLAAGHSDDWSRPTTPPSASSWPASRGC